jgi:hypothetical protein
MFYVVFALILFKLLLFNFIIKYIQRPRFVQFITNLFNKKNKMINNNNNIVKEEEEEENKMNSCYFKFKLIEPNDNDTIPSKRSGHRAIVYNDNFYIWGGFNPKRDNRQFDLYAQLWKYNLFTNKWLLLETSG